MEVKDRMIIVFDTAVVVVLDESPTIPVVAIGCNAQALRKVTEGEAGTDVKVVDLVLIVAVAEVAVVVVVVVEKNLLICILHSSKNGSVGARLFKSYVSGRAHDVGTII